MKKKNHTGLRAIAIFKFIKGAGLILLTIGAFGLIHKDVEAVAEHAIGLVRMDPDGKYFRIVLRALAKIDDSKLEIISISAFFYATLIMIEGLGLWYEKKWAEWLTIGATSLFIPIEIYEIAAHANWRRVMILVINITIVSYLAWVLKRTRHT